MYLSIFAVVITVEPSMTALTVQEASQMVVIEMMTSDVPGQPVPITITYITTNGTAIGGFYVHIWLYYTYIYTAEICMVGKEAITYCKH